jgi:hypothetical protein
MRRIRILLIAALAALSVTMMTAGTASASNKEAAKACQKTGWELLFNQSGSRFTSTDECTGYAAEGGVLATLQVVLQHEEHCFGIPLAFSCISAGATGFGLKPASTVVFKLGDVAAFGTVAANGAINTGPRLGASPCPGVSGVTASGEGTTASGGTIKAVVTGPTSC